MILIGRHLLIKICYISIDIVFFCLSIVAACWLRHTTLSFDITVHNLFFDAVNPYRFFFFFWGLVTVFMNNAYALYQTEREINETVEIWRVFKSICAASLIAIVTIYTVKIEGFPRSILLLVAIFTVFSFSFWRICKRIFVNYLVSQGYNNFNVLIVGAGKVGKNLAREINKRPALGLNIVGYLDDFKTNDEDNGGPKILGGISDFAKVARREFVNKVFITVHHDSQVFFTLLEKAKEMNIAVRVVPQGFELMSGEFCKYNIGFIPVLEYSNSEAHHKQAGKRLFDLFAALCLTVLISPVFVIIAALIKLDSPGPVFYFSRRYGRGGRMFHMFKFRSMHMNADKAIEKIRHKNEVDGPIFKIRKDPRVTKIGQILRKYSLDELPQLLNVVRGDMSLVGPRPLPIAQVQKEDFRQLRRLEVRPGITGLWQIRGRSDISFARLVKWDVWYINNWSFWLDINILLQTVPVVLEGKGAY